MRGFLIVFLGAGLGGALRHGVNLGAARLLPGAIGASTLTVNVLGALLMGILIEGLAIKFDAPQQWRLFLATGVLGGFTTFSAFSLEVALLYERGQVLASALYVMASVVGSIGALFAGLLLVRHFAGSPA
jgi:CrcB protein